MRATTQPLPFAGPVRTGAAAALAALLLAAPAAVHAQSVFPPNEPRVIVDEDVSSATAPALPVGISQYNWTATVPTDMASSADAVSCGGSFWGTHLVQTRGLAGPPPEGMGDRTQVLSKKGTSNLFVVDDSVMGKPGYLARDWESFRFEFDFTGDANAAVGVLWAGADPDNNLWVDHGWLFYVDQLPTQAEAVNDGDRARWHLVRRLSRHDVELASGEVELRPGDDNLLSIYSGACYRLRLEYFCGNLRLQVARINCAADCAVSQCDGTSVTCADWETCAVVWCDLYEWLDTGFSVSFPQPQGFVGAFAGGIDRATAAVSRFDNFLARTWDYACSDWCGEWSGWTEAWGAAGDSREALDLKFLYTGALVDYAYGHIWDGQVGVDPYFQRIDVAVDLNAGGRDLCSGWTVLHSGDPLLPIVDLPDWSTATSNLDELLAYLEPMASSVKLVNDGGTLSFVDSFDNARLDGSGDPNPDYDPNPLPTWGSTPINKSLLEAYDWYEDQRTVGAWASDPLEECRLWYVIFITDGEERCPTNIPNAACVGDGTNPGAAQLFASPPVAGIDPVKVYTVGFSESVPADSPLRCIADITGGQFYSATNAGQLVDVLYDVIDTMQESDRQFIPFVVSPPPAAGGQPSDVEDFLTVFPNFVPRNKQTIWEGDLLAFAFNRSQPTLPVTADCTVDTTQMVWELGGSPAGAGAILDDQVVSSTRNVFMGSDLTGSWARHAVTDIFDTDAAGIALRTEFKDMLDVAGGASDLEAVEVVNFVRNIHVNPAGLGLSPAPANPPRPNNYRTLGDVYHSQPRVINPPNNFMFFSDFGLGPAHDYLSFREKHAKRRRVVLAGANDGQLHAFDGGFFDRDDGGTYDDAHDLGTGIELFSWVPEAVVNRLYRMTYGTEHQYMVDGMISVGEVFIDHDGDSNREWRTVALATMRRGGRGVLALDITTPDPVLAADDWQPPESVFPGCLDGTASGCDAEYPKLLWEFHDTDTDITNNVVDGTGVPNDDDANCPVGFTGDQCEPYWDLGWTWSQPAIARIGVYALDGGGNVRPDDTWVAFFGGGWDRTETDITGLYFYGVDIETGATVVKENIGVPVPGTPALLDSDNDGFHDKIYFGDTNGAIWRLQFPSPFTAGATGAAAGTLRRIFDVSTTSLTTTYGRQQFFHEPALVPVVFNGANYTYAVAMGSGDRANLGEDTSSTVNHFFVVLDDLDNDSVANPAYDETDLVARAWDTDLVNAFTPDPGATLCTDSAFDTDKGWYLSLRNDLGSTPPGGSEKVNFKATIFASHVYFTTFQPTEDTADNPPEICVPATPPGTPSPTATPDPTAPIAPEVCRASGIGRMYDLGLACGLGEYTEVNDVLTGISVWTIGNTTYVQGTTSGAGSTGGITGGLGPRKEHAVDIIASTTNWRQE
ncbi:MAG TPA: PilC/PilY family type IV pilus protein [Methylomirabilota bacterium]|nr:PilC/PilY family type IV pilus protein [Methylomirabilota bacterium]